MSEPARLNEDTEAALLLEIARLHVAILSLIRGAPVPDALKAEIAALIWPPHQSTENLTMTEPVPVPIPPSPFVSFANWLRDTAERSVATFVVALLSLLSVDALSDINMDWGKRLGTTAIIAIAAFVKNAVLPKSGLGLPPLLDVVARAGWSAVQAGATVVVLADTAFAWYQVSAWQTVGIAAAAAFFSVVKGAIALHVKPELTVTPASFVTAA